MRNDDHEYVQEVDDDEDDLDLDNDDRYDFLKDKHDSDKSLVHQLNQITNQSELRIESAASNNDFLRNRRAGSSRDHSATFLYTPPSASNNNSRPGSNTSSSRRTANASRPIVNIPPADKNMEVVIGKGRRVNSSNGVGSGGGVVGSSSRGNSSRANHSPSSGGHNSSIVGQRKNSLNGMPPLPASATRLFSCENCNKKYSNGKDLDIHKMYCNI